MTFEARNCTASRLGLLLGFSLARILLLPARAQSVFAVALTRSDEMRRVLSVVIAGALTLLFSAQARAQTLTFTATLSGSNEAPPVAATGAGGFATITINLSAQTLDWVVDVFNFPSGVTAGHIHAGGAGVAGPVVVNFVVPTGASNDFRLTGTARPADVVARQPQGVNSWEDLVQAIMTGNAYVNVHSQVNPGGEIRGQLTQKQ
jgi:hypothetical protein